MLADAGRVLADAGRVLADAGLSAKDTQKILERGARLRIFKPCRNVAALVHNQKKGAAMSYLIQDTIGVFCIFAICGAPLFF